LEKNKLPLKRLSDHFFALLPECLSVLWIERVSTHAFGANVEGNVVRHDLANMAILAIPAADLVRLGYHGSPHGCSGPLRNGLPLERLAFRRELLIDPVEKLLYLGGIHVASELGPNAARMYG